MASPTRHFSTVYTLIADEKFSQHFQCGPADQLNGELVSFADVVRPATVLSVTRADRHRVTPVNHLRQLVAAPLLEGRVVPQGVKVEQGQGQALACFSLQDPGTGSGAQAFALGLQAGQESCGCRYWKAAL